MRNITIIIAVPEPSPTEAQVEAYAALAAQQMRDALVQSTPGAAPTS